MVLGEGGAVRPNCCLPALHPGSCEHPEGGMPHYPVTHRRHIASLLMVAPGNKKGILLAPRRSPAVWPVSRPHPTLQGLRHSCYLHTSLIHRCTTS